MSPSRFEYIPTPISGLTLIQRKPLEDERGFFARFYCEEEWQAQGLNFPIVQINHSLTQRQGVVRGFHFQYPPHTEAKVISCLRGEIFDVTIDIRRDSPTFLRWHGEILSAANRRSLLAPEGFAHGFQTLTEDCELLYLHSKSYKKEFEGALNVQDPRLAVQWPLPISDLSERDRSHPFIRGDFSGLTI